VDRKKSDAIDWIRHWNAGDETSKSAAGISREPVFFVFGDEKKNRTRCTAIFGKRQEKL
jgi:hypothetical protein